MREQGNNAWGLTVSRRFETAAEATGAVESLKQAGFRDEEIRVWQHKRSAGSSEDRLARTFEALLAGGVISGMVAAFVFMAYAWTSNENLTMEEAPLVGLIAAVAGAVVTAIAVTIISTRFAFSHPHEVPDEPPSVVTVTVGDRESEAKSAFGA